MKKAHGMMDGWVKPKWEFISIYFQLKQAFNLKTASANVNWISFFRAPLAAFWNSQLQWETSHGASETSISFHVRVKMLLPPLLNSFGCQRPACRRRGRQCVRCKSESRISTFSFSLSLSLSLSLDFNDFLDPNFARTQLELSEK